MVSHESRGLKGNFGRTWLKRLSRFWRQLLTTVIVSDESLIVIVCAFTAIR